MRQQCPQYKVGSGLAGFVYGALMGEMTTLAVLWSSGLLITFAAIPFAGALCGTLAALACTATLPLQAPSGVSPLPKAVPLGSPENVHEPAKT